MDLHAGVIEGEYLLGLQTVSEESTGQREPDHDGHRRVTGVARAVIRIDGGGDGVVQPRHLLDAAIGLAGQVDDGHDCTLGVHRGI